MEQILKGAKHAIEHSDYLPTLNRMLECCQQGLAEFGLPSAHDAYVEACRAPSPKSAQTWSHPAVYLAGRDSDWFFLANNTERTSWPVFKEHYQKYCAAYCAVKHLKYRSRRRWSRNPLTRCPPREQLAQLQNLRAKTGL